MARLFCRELISTLILGLHLSVTCVYADERCPPSKGVALQVLGSGGPIADDGRASSSYLLWRDGRAIALVDAGGGAFLRFGEAGAAFADLDAILLTHLHADHSADLPALLKSGYFSRRERPLLIAGPPAGGTDRVPFPAFADYMTALLRPDGGAYAYLAGYLDGSGGMPRLDLITLEDTTLSRSGAVEATVFAPVGSDLVISSIAVPHGIVPAQAYRLQIDGVSVVFAGDQNGSSPALEQLAEAADLLVLHMPIGERAGGAARALHAIPSRLGAIARAAQVKRVLLSHFMARSLVDLDANVEEVRSAYGGPVIVAEDLACLTLL